MNYGMVLLREGGIAGGVGPNRRGKAHATFYVSAPRTSTRRWRRSANSAAQTIMPPMDVPDGPRIAFFTDPGR